MLNIRQIILTVACVAIPATILRAEEENANSTTPSLGGERADSPANSAVESNNSNTEDTLKTSLPDPSQTNQTWSFAAGATMAWTIRQDYGARSFRRFEPEVFGFMYQGLPFEGFWLRHGARLSYSNDQPQMPKSIRIEETDWKLSIEEGLTYDWYVAPSFTLGIGYDWRTIRAKSQSPIVSVDSRVNTKESFMWGFAQVGCGIPVMNGEYLIEPYIRRHKLTADRRSIWAYGIEVSMAF